MRRRHGRARPARRARGRRRRARAPGRPRPRRRRDRRRRRRARRVDDHRRVEARGRGARATGSPPARSRPTRRSASASTAVGEETALAGIQRLVAEAQTSRSRTQALADRAAALLFYVAVGAAVVTFVVWALLGDVDVARDQHGHRARHLLPARARAGDPARDRDLDLAGGPQRNPRQGPPQPRAQPPRRRRPLRQDGHADARRARRHGRRRAGIATPCWRRRGAVEAESEHPLARAIVAAARERGAIPAARDFRAMSGRGVEASRRRGPRRGRRAEPAARARPRRARRAPARDGAVAEPRRLRPLPRATTAPSSAPSRSRTRSARRRARRSSGCTSSASASR